MTDKPRISAILDGIRSAIPTRSARKRHRSAGGSKSTAPRISSRASLDARLSVGRGDPVRPRLRWRAAHAAVAAELGAWCMMHADLPLAISEAERPLDFVVWPFMLNRVGVSRARMRLRSARMKRSCGRKPRTGGSVRGGPLAPRPQGPIREAPGVAQPRGRGS